MLRARLHEEKPLIQVVIGPRQVGKTTAIRHIIADQGLYRTADSPTPLLPDEIATWWMEAERLPPRVLAIDEVQKIPPPKLILGARFIAAGCDVFYWKDRGESDLPLRRSFVIGHWKNRIDSLKNWTMIRPLQFGSVLRSN